MNKITVKRIIPIYTVVTDNFKKELTEGTATEIRMIDNQIIAINNQIKQLHSRFGLLKNQATQQAQEQINRSIIELNERNEQFKALKNNLLQTSEEIKNKKNGTEIQSGLFENYVEINVGDNIKNIFENAKIVIKDNIVQEIIN